MNKKEIQVRAERMRKAQDVAPEERKERLDMWRYQVREARAERMRQTMEEVK